MVREMERECKGVYASDEREREGEEREDGKDSGRERERVHAESHIEFSLFKRVKRHEQIT